MTWFVVYLCIERLGLAHVLRSLSTYALARMPPRPSGDFNSSSSYQKKQQFVDTHFIFCKALAVQVNLAIVGNSMYDMTSRSDGGICWYNHWRPMDPCLMRKTEPCPRSLSMIAARRSPIHIGAYPNIHISTSPHTSGYPWHQAETRAADCWQK